MKNFKKKMLLAFLIAMTANTSYSSSAKKNSKDDNEFIILGTYQKLENTFTKNDIKKHSNNIDPLNPINPVNPADSDGTGGNTPGPDSMPNPTPEPLVPTIDVVKESGTVAAKKFFYGENLTHNVSGDITSNNEEALWMTDKNTIVVNNNKVEANYEINKEEYNIVHVDNYAKFINNGTVSGAYAIGVYLNDHSSFENTASGVINNLSSYGVKATNNSSAVNYGVIENTGQGAMVASGASLIENKESGIIKNNNSIGMYILGDSESLAINRGIIANEGFHGMWISKGTGENYGTIRNQSEYGVSLLYNASFENYGLIENNGAYGIWAYEGSTAVNQAGGIVRNAGNNGMNVITEGAVLTTAINNGLIENTGEYGMSSTGVNGSVVNNGTIKNLSKYGMAAVEGSSAVNTGIIENVGSHGMSASTGASAINEGTIKNIGSRGMNAENGGTIENKENGIIANTSNHGMHAIGIGSLAINRGIIQNTGTYSMWIGANAVGKNYGILQNKGSYGVVVADKGRMENYGIIENTGDNGIWAQSDGMAVNGVDGIIRNTGNTGMMAMGGSGSTTTIINNGLIENTGNNGMNGTNYTAVAINNGTIKNKGNFAMASNGSAVNNGLIELTGDNKTGMSISTGTGVGINNGTIIMHGTNEIGMYASNKATIINQGTITLDGTGTGMSAVGGSHIVLGNGSTINIGSQTMTATGSETTADGFYITADGTSDVNNQGAIASNGKITIDGTGKFILNSATGSL